MKFETRQSEFERARAVLNSFIDKNPTYKAYLKAAKFEESQRQKEKARAIYERCLQELGQQAYDENFFMAFARFEVYHKQYTRA